MTVPTNGDRLDSDFGPPNYGMADDGPGDLSGDAEIIDARTFHDTFGESLDAALDFATWPRGGDLLALYHQLEAELASAARDELGHMATIRKIVLPRLAKRPGAPAGMGFFRLTLDEIRRAHSAMLFNGGVEASRGTVASHDTLALTVTQLGVSLVNYQGDRGTWGHRLFRRDLRFSPGTVEDLALRVVEHRQAGAAEDSVTERRLSMLARRGILAYAERAALTDEATAPWRMGAGNPIPYEMITGGGSMELAIRSTELLTRLIHDRRRFVFVSPDTRERGLLTIGNALAPLEYVIVDSGLPRLRSLTDRANYMTRDKLTVDTFVAETGPALRLGVYRASEVGQPRLFWGHQDHIHEAALIAIADSVLHEHRAFPMLLDLAEQVCRGMFPAAELVSTSQMAQIDAGLPIRYAVDQEVPGGPSLARE